MPHEEALIDFAPEGAGPPSPAMGGREWKLLIVDDDEEVHQATRFSLRQVHVCGRSLRLIHAHTAEQAVALLKAESDVAVVLLDVVMERPDAGLQLVRRIREELRLAAVRIVLRTGQPGYAPELDVIRDYDINDYKTKAELTHTRLLTTLIAAIRSYDQIRTIAENRRGLELILGAAAGLMEARALSGFAEGVLTQIAALLDLPGDGIVCAQRGGVVDGEGAADLHVVAAGGRLAACIGHPLAELAETDIVAAIRRCLVQKRHLFEPPHTILYLHGQQHEAAVCVRSGKPLEAVDRQLLEVFAANISSSFGNVKLVERLNFIAYHDPLTGLGNRARFLDDLARAGAAAQPGQAVCLLDLDRFTDLNSGLGHEIGDLLLKAVAARLSAACGDCRVARLDADTFGLVGPVAQLAPERLFALLQAPFAVGEQQLATSATFGYCLIAGGESGATLFTHADIALNEAQISRLERYRYFDPEMEAATCRRLSTIRDLRHDFFAGQLALWYQPQVSLVDERMIGFEALLRWPAGAGFVQPPAVFVPLAEQSGLILDIGDWVLDRACAAFCRLRAGSRDAGRVAVNVSMPQFRRPDFPQRVVRTLDKYGMPAAALELEITESILLEDPAVVLDNIGNLRARGVHISVDDFGTGYSSLAYLQQLPIDCLKIDRAFVSDIGGDKGDVFAETIIRLAGQLGIETIAEGVESPAQVNRLRELGCSIAQGFHYARPMPVEALERWIDRRAAH